MAAGSGRARSLDTKEFRFDSDTVLVHREGSAVILEPAREWPAEWIESFVGVPDDFERPDQGAVDGRRKL